MNTRISGETIHVISGLNLGGAERSLYNLVKHGSQFMPRSVVISLTGTGYYSSLLRDAGVQVYELNLKSVSGILQFLKLQTSLKHKNIRIIHGWMYHGNLVAWYLKRLLNGNIHVYWNIRQSLDDPGAISKSGRLANFFCLKLSSGIDAVIYNSHRGKKTHEELGYDRSKSRVIFNGFDINCFRPNRHTSFSMRKKCGLSEQNYVIGFIGRDDPSKNIPMLISAFQRAAKLRPNLALVCIGNISEQRFHSCQGLNVINVGTQDNIEEWIRIFDVLCLPSKWEGFSNVVGEAMSSAVPCIVSDVGDSANIVSDCGWVLPRNDESALVEKLIEVAALPLSRLREIGLNARKRIVANYSIDRMIEAYYLLYENGNSEMWQEF